MAWSRDRCCVAVPLYNVGIYAILAQFAVISIVTAVLSFAAPYIVAVSIPSFGSYLLGGVCLVLFGLQAWGFFGVYKEKPATFRKYVAVNTIVLILAFILALVWIILSAVKHTTAVNACIQQFITNSGDSGTTTNASEVNVSSGAVSGGTLCSIFTWVQTGVMGGLWLALLIVECYFALISRIYGSEQREDHKRYNSIYTEQRHTIMRQSMMWENGRISSDGDPTAVGAPGALGHARNFSKSSALRNEVRVTGDDDDEYAYEAAGNQSNPEGYLDVPLHTSPTKSSNGTAYPASNHSAQYANSRSNLAPVDSSPAYMHQRNGSAAQYAQQPAYGRQSRHENDNDEDFAGYYAS